MLVAPGVLLVAVGVAFVALGLIVPSGVSVGSLRWQPSFICGIALVVGVQAIVAGFAISERERSNIGSAPTRRRASLPAICLTTGIAAGIVGVGIDIALFVVWLRSGSTFTRELVIAAGAQALVINGACLTGFGLIYPLLVRDGSGDVGRRLDSQLEHHDRD
jgi:hypothetical protein